ncbi:MAG: decaprenyl-phosphate phosphoribosyltransferase [Melioribacteraceae bacterium]|nr:decaprenyl-phosphate phosphoribosyltransferase [Melioribacteraceae bacterium]
MIGEYLKLFRINHWLKNIFVFIPIVFAQRLFEVTAVYNALGAFLSFSLAASAVYIINDIADSDKDRNHPVKKERPIAKGAITIQSALSAAFVLIAVSVILLTQLPLHFLIVVAGYFLLNILYSFYLKNIVILDIMCVAAGFMLRVIGGAVVIDVYISKWLILTALFLSLFLAVMKRKSELKIITNGLPTRTVLKHYSSEFINQISAVTSSAVIICYALYTVSERTISVFNTENLIFTTIFFIFGILRYMFLVYSQNKGENSIEIVIKDVPMLVNSFLYLLTVLLIIYL